MRKIFSVAKWEIIRYRKSKLSIATIILMISSVLILPFSLSSISFTGERLSSGVYHIYTVCVSDEELYEKLSKFPKFSLSKNDSGTGTGTCDVIITKENGTFYAEPKTDKGRTALKDIKGSEEEINKKEISLIKNTTNYFLLQPVVVYVNLISTSDTYRAKTEISRIIENNTAGNAGNAAKNASDASKAIEDTLAEYATEKSVSSPGDISIPFPFMFLLSYFIIISPIFFFSIFFASSIMREKIAKSEVLLISPLTKFDIIFGKMLPYLFFVLLMSCSAAFILGEFSIATPLTILPLTLCIFGLSSFVAIASKTPKDMNFTLMFVYLGFFAYLFYPAMFYEMNKISLLSPIASMIELSKENITLQTFILMLSPPVFVGLVFILISMGMFRYDILFTVQKLRDKILQGTEVFSSPELNCAFFMLILSPFIYFISAFLSLLLLLNPVFPVFLIAAVEEAGKISGVAFLASKNKIKSLKSGMAAAILSAGTLFIVYLVLTAFFSEVLPFEIKFSFGMILELIIQVSCSAVSAYGFIKKKGKICLYSITFLLLGIAAHSAFYFAI